MEMVRITSVNKEGITKILPGGRRIPPGEEVVIPRELYERVKVDPDIQLVSVESGEVEQTIDQMLENYEEVIRQKDEQITELQKEIAALKARLAELESSAPIRSKAREIVASPWRRRRSIIEDLDPEDDRDLLETILDLLRKEKMTKSIETDINIIELKLAQSQKESELE